MPEAPHHPVATEFEVAGTRVAGLHWSGRGDALANDLGRPCVVMAHGFGSTVDSGLEPFAARLAEAGLDVLAFDYRGFGHSDGQPRQVLSIEAQLADYHAAIAHARGLAGVDGARVVLWGVSFSGGHVLRVAAEDGRAAAVVALTPSVDGRATARAAARTADPRATARLLRLAVRDRLAARHGRAVLVPLTTPPGRLGLMSGPGVHEAYTAIAGPSWRNQIAPRILLEMGRYRPIQWARDVEAPLLLQIGDQDRTALPLEAEKAAVGRAEVRHYPADHFDVYEGAPWHEAVCEDQVAFLRRHLARQAAPQRAADATT